MSKLNYAPGFFDLLRVNDLLGPTLSTDEVRGLNALTEAFGEANWPIAFASYGLGTAYLETGHTMLPIKEFGGESYFRRMYDKTGARPQKAAELGNTQVGDGALFAGRGYPQLTGRANYAKADAQLGLGGALLRNPDLAMRPDIAAKIMVKGMQQGWFTGKKLADYLPAVGPGTVGSFTSARKIVNGTDRAADIAQFAAVFQVALEAGRWA